MPNVHGDKHCLAFSTVVIPGRELVGLVLEVHGVEPLEEGVVQPEVDVGVARSEGIRLSQSTAILLIKIR